MCLNAHCRVNGQTPILALALDGAGNLQDLVNFKFKCDDLVSVVTTSSININSEEIPVSLLNHDNCSADIPATFVQTVRNLEPRNVLSLHASPDPSLHVRPPSQSSHRWGVRKIRK